MEYFNAHQDLHSPTSTTSPDDKHTKPSEVKYQDTTPAVVHKEVELDFGDMYGGGEADNTFNPISNGIIIAMTPMSSPKETRPASPDDAAVSNHSHVTKDKSREEPLEAASVVGFSCCCRK